MGVPCPDESTLSRFAAGLGEAAERAPVEAHLDTCEACRAVVAVLAQTMPTQGRQADADVDRLLSVHQLSDHYDVESVLGAGGMGVVLGARHRLLGHQVAIKVLRPSLRLHAGSEQRFLNEARAGVRLSSPHIARVLDAGRLADGLPFLVMERLAGEDGERFLSHGVPPVAETLDMATQVLAALAEAHGIGLVHRDLKPANLFFTRRHNGRVHVKVLDFGLAKVMGDDLGLTSSQGFLGSPLYVAPEQLRHSSDVDARADIWGVGCLLYRFLTGRVPFPASSVAEVVTRIQRDEPTPLRQLRPDTPEPLATLVSQLLAKSPLKRPASAVEVGIRLRPLLAERVAQELDEALALPVTPVLEGPARPRPRAGQSPLLVLGGVAGGLVAGALLGLSVRPAPSSLPVANPVATVAAEPVMVPSAPAAASAPPSAAQMTDGGAATADKGQSAQTTRTPGVTKRGRETAPDADAGDVFEQRE